jgi:hypothetical protein
LYVGTIPAGGLCAFLQSAGAIGLGAGPIGILVVTGAAVTSLGAFGIFKLVQLVKKKKKLLLATTRPPPPHSAPMPPVVSAMPEIIKELELVQKNHHVIVRTVSPAKKGIKGFPLPPFGLAGVWVRRAEFQGTKSFGFFICYLCKHSWLSAYADKRYRQGCKKCNFMRHPKLMWLNHSTDRNRKGRKKEKKPHLVHLCEAGRLHHCDAVGCNKKIDS